MTQDIYHECFLLELTVSYTIRKWHRKGNMFNKNHPGCRQPFENYTKLQISDKFWFKSVGKFTLSSYGIYRSRIQTCKRFVAVFQTENMSSIAYSYKIH